MTDWHAHVGQWHETYYDPAAVVRALAACGTDEAWLSSTSSEIYCKESLAVQDRQDLRNDAMTARELYEYVRGEMEAALAAAEGCGAKAHPLYWVVPEVHFSAEACVTVESAMRDFPYEGFKLHPRGNPWDLNDRRTLDLAHEVFSHAEERGLPVLIHAGPDPFELPDLFAPLVKAHPRVTVQLAHCRPLEDTLAMLRAYPNVVCDTAFVDDETRERIRAAGFGERIRFGTDFPITHYHAARPDHNPTEAELTDWLNAQGAR